MFCKVEFIFLGLEMRFLRFYFQIFLFVFVCTLNSDIFAAYRDFISVYNAVSDEKVEDFASALSFNADFFKYDPVAIAKAFIKKSIENGKIEVEAIDKFNKVFVFASGEGWLDVLEVFFACPVLMSKLDPKFTKNAFINAVDKGHADVVEKLLENRFFVESMKRLLSLSDLENEKEFSSEFNVFNVFIESMLNKCSVGVFKILFKDEGILSLISKEVIHLIIKKCIILGQVDLLQIVLDNKHTKNLFSDAEISSFLLELNKMYGQAGYPYEQMQNVFNVKKRVSSQKNNCTIF